MGRLGEELAGGWGSRVWFRTYSERPTSLPSGGVDEAVEYTGQTRGWKSDEDQIEARKRGKRS